MRFPRTQIQNTRDFFSQLGLNPSTLTEEDLYEIQDRIASRYRIVFIKYVS